MNGKAKQADSDQCRRLRFGSSAAAAALLLLLVSCPLQTAQAQDDISERNNQAVALSQSGDYAGAVAIWSELVDSVPGDFELLWALHKNIGRSYQKLGQHRRAWKHLVLSLEIGPGKSTLVPKWLDEVEALLKTDHVLVLLEIPEGEGEISVANEDGTRSRFPAPLKWWFQPGEHALGVYCKSGDYVERVIMVLDVGGAFELALPSESVLVIEEPDDVQDSVDVPLWKWLMLGGAGALAVAGGVTYLVADSNLGDQRSAHLKWVEETYGVGSVVPPDQEAVVQADWDDRLADNVTPLEVTSYVLWGAAGAVAITGGVLIALDLVGSEETSTSVVVPFLFSDGVGLTLEQVF